MLRAGIDRKYAFVLLGACGVLLALGIKFRPGAVAGEEALSEIEIQSLQRLAEQRRLRDVSSFLNQAASQAGMGLTVVLPARATGVLWGNPPSILVPKGASEADMLTAVAWDGTPHGVRPGAMDSSRPFELLTLAQTDGLSARPIAANPPATGEWILAVARGPSNEVVFAHGLYQGVRAAHCGDFLYQAMQTSIPISQALTGGGLFTIDGQLLGFIAACEGQPILISAPAVEQALRMPPTLETRIEREYGFVVSKMGDSQRVTSVWQGSRADQAGLRAGDELAARTDLQALMSDTGVEHEIEVVRQDRSMTLRLEPYAQALAATTIGITFADAPGGEVRVHAVSPESAASRAGLRAGDIIERVSNSSVSNAAAAAAAVQRSGRGPLTLTVGREEKRLEVWIQP